MEKFYPKNLLPGCAFTVLLFLMCLENLTSISILQTLFRHIDELIVLGCLLYLLLHIRYLFAKKRMLLYVWIIFLFIGAISSLIYDYQGIWPTLVDAVVVINKFMVGYLSAHVYAKLHKGNVALRLIGTARFLSIIFFLIAIHDIFFTPFFPLGEFRYFTYSLSLMFPHSTYLSAAMVTLLVLLGYANRKWENIPYMLMVSFVGMMTLRGKAIAFFMVYWVLFICIYVFRNRHYLAMLVGGGVGSVIIAFEQISDYFLTTTRFSPRQILLQDSITLALEHFPLGTGFGTFGSTIAAQYYSVLYTHLGYTDLRGMNPTDTAFLTDSFWPEIIAQFGLVGAVLFIAVVIMFVGCCLKQLKTNVPSGFAMLAIMLNMLINSMAESSFFNPTSFLLFILFGLFEAHKNVQKSTSLNDKHERIKQL